MASPRTNHFGNPFVTATVGRKNSPSLQIKAPPSPVGSTFSKNDFLKTKTISRQSAEHLSISFGSFGSRGSMPSYQRQALSPNISFSERETISQNDLFAEQQHSVNETSKLVGSTITTGSTIGLPSHYPGSAGHQRIGSLESSVLLEELQDFDDIFEQGLASTPCNTPTHHEDGENERELTVSSRRQDEYDNDDDDDLQSFSRSNPSQFSFHHNRNISELSGLTISTQIDKQKVASRSSSWIGSSNYSSASSTRSLSTISRNHRRSRNRALSSTEFQSAVLDEL